MIIHANVSGKAKLHSYETETQFLFTFPFDNMFILLCYISENKYEGRYLDGSPYYTTHIKKFNYEGIIFPKGYTLFLINDSAGYTPDVLDIKHAEKIIRDSIRVLNKDRINQDSGPIIHKNLRKYKRQYFGKFNEKGQKLIIIGLSWDRLRLIDKIGNRRDVDKWKTEELNVMDGGSYYWSISINLSTNEIINFNVHGVG